MERVTCLLETTCLNGTPLAKLLRRPDADWSVAAGRLPELAGVEAEVIQQVLCDLKYAGYVARQQVEIDRQARLAEKRIPPGFDYARLSQLRAEAREKLSRVRPRDLSQAGRISGITPADLALVMVHLDRGGDPAKGHN
jgi:tRNA uridine 5-carboxymethylaminomethyl modification enzyme